jgi:hypothetical protein
MFDLLFALSRDLSLALSLCLALASPTLAQGPPNAAALLAAQRAAMAKLSFMDGVWRGPAATTQPSGKVHQVTQTERIGPFLDGAVKVMEGRGYDARDSVTFNAFGTVSYDPGKNAYTLHSHAMGMVGDFAFTPADSGYVWEIPVGAMTIRYTAVIRGGKWREIGERVMPGGDPVQFFEMNLVRIGDSAWPGAGAIPPR